MKQMNKHYESEFKKKIVRLHLEEGRTLNGLAAEYGIAKASISNWVKQFREECQVNNKAQAEYDCIKENLQLKKQLAELKTDTDQFVHIWFAEDIKSVIRQFISI